MKQLTPIHDNDPIKLTWDAFLECVILLSSIITPYRLTFGYPQIDINYWLITLVFALDLSLDFIPSSLGINF